MFPHENAFAPHDASTKTAPHLTFGGPAGRAFSPPAAPQRRCGPITATGRRAGGRSRAPGTCRCGWADLRLQDPESRVLPDRVGTGDEQPQLDAGTQQPALEPADPQQPGRGELTVRPRRAGRWCGSTRLNGHPRPAQRTLTLVPGRRVDREPADPGAAAARPARRSVRPGTGSAEKARAGRHSVPGTPGAPTFSTSVATSVAFVAMRSEIVYVPATGIGGRRARPLRVIEDSVAVQVPAQRRCRNRRVRVRGRRHERDQLAGHRPGGEEDEGGLGRAVRRSRVGDDRHRPSASR